MLVNRVDLCSYDLVNRLVFAFRDPDSTLPFQVRSIGGLDAENIALMYTGVGEFSIPTLLGREIVIALNLNPYVAQGLTFSFLRDEVYRMLGGIGAGKLRLRFKMGEADVAEVSGSITKIEAAQFEQKQEMQITIDCKHSPMLSAVTQTDVDVADIVSAEVEGLVVVEDLDSTALHGFRFAVRLTDNSSVFILSSSDGWNFGINYAFRANDVLHVSSEPNGKEVYVQRGLTKIQLADRVAEQSVWPLMKPGQNEYEFIAAFGVEVVSMSFYPTYWGV